MRRALGGDGGGGGGGCGGGGGGGGGSGSVCVRRALRGRLYEEGISNSNLKDATTNTTKQTNKQQKRHTHTHTHTDRSFLRPGPVRRAL